MQNILCIVIQIFKNNRLRGEVMKKKHSAITILTILILLYGMAHGGDWSLTRPRGVGFSLVGTRQDASQMNSAGHGLGAEFFLKYPFNSLISVLRF